MNDIIIITNPVRGKGCVARAIDRPNQTVYELYVDYGDVAEDREILMRQGNFGDLVHVRPLAMGFEDSATVYSGQGATALWGLIAAEARKIDVNHPIWTESEKPPKPYTKRYLDPSGEKWR